MMLRHLGSKNEAAKLEAAMERTLALGNRTRDAGGRLDTGAFTKAYLEVLGTL